MAITDILSLLQNPEGSVGQTQAPYPQGAQVGGNYLQGFIQNLMNIVQGTQQAYGMGGNPWEGL